MITLIPLTVNCLTIKAPSPFPKRIKGTLKVKAKAPITPSIEKEASNISRNKILLIAPKWGFKSFVSSAEAFFLNPSVIKKAVAPIDAERANTGCSLTAKNIIPVRKIEENA